MKLRDHQYSKLIKKLMSYDHKGIGFNGEGTCSAGNYIFSITNFFIPLKSTPKSIELSSIKYTNCTDLEVMFKSKYGFITKAKVVRDGQAYCIFNWKIKF